MKILNFKLPAGVRSSRDAPSFITMVSRDCPPKLFRNTFTFTYLLWYCWKSAWKLSDTLRFFFRLTAWMARSRLSTKYIKTLFR